jgi:hypothetical protein
MTSMSAAAIMTICALLKKPWTLGTCARYAFLVQKSRSHRSRPVSLCVRRVQDIGQVRVLKRNSCCTSHVQANRTVRRSNGFITDEVGVWIVDDPRHAKPLTHKIAGEAAESTSDPSCAGCFYLFAL